MSNSETRLIDEILADDARIHTCLVAYGSLCHDALLECKRLGAQRDALLAACKSLTAMGTLWNGAVIVGPRGWHMVQDAIALAEGGGE
jgi:hypothetical protein